ncbi:MAG: hypothetical protein ACRENE_00465, partial [Polyangiaceae bacterium]
RADVWAIGAILYHLLAGKPPYEGENQLATLHMLGSGRPPKPLPSSVHPAIQAVVRRALTHDPDGRAETAADMRDAIERAMASANMHATAADVAAFATDHLADRNEKRRATVEAALAAAAERKRIEDLFEPALGRERYGRRSAMPPPPSSHPSLVSHGAGTLAESPDAMLPQPLDLVSRLSPRHSDPVPQPSSYATLGLAAVDASQTFPPQAPRAHRGLVATVGVLAIAVGLAAGVRFNLIHTDLPNRWTNASSGPDPRPLPSATPVPPVAPPPPMLVAPTELPVATPTPTGSAFSLLPTVSLTALPKAGTPPAPGQPDPAAQPRRPAQNPARWTPPHRATPSAPAQEPEETTPAPEPAPPPAAAPEPAPTPPPPPAPTGKQKNGGIDDGF